MVWNSRLVQRREISDRDSWLFGLCSFANLLPYVAVRYEPDVPIAQNINVLGYWAPYTAVSDVFIHDVPQPIVNRAGVGGSMFGVYRDRLSQFDPRPFAQSSPPAGVIWYIKNFLPAGSLSVIEWTN